MNKEMDKTYDPSVVEQKWYDSWLKNDIFSSHPDSTRRPFTVVIPPPNVTGSLHMGHALNATMQDIIVRFKRMQGFNPLWVPGTDHGGIATQNVVEKLLKAEGKSRHDLGREKFLERMWQWRTESGDTILMQLRRLGCSLDWSRTRFTMDETCSRAVTAAFVKLFEKGLIYRGKRLVNWCPRCHTALADIEVEHEEEVGKLWHIKYVLKSRGLISLFKKKYIVVATTRPETMLGDTAVAVHPDDKRYKDLIGSMVVLPLIGREIPVIADTAIDPSFGTGAVKVTPAHDPVDFEIGVRHQLDRIEVIDFHGKMTAAAGEPYAGLDRFAARKKILNDLEAQKLLLETANHPHAVGHCYRCATVIEPLLSEQWFLKVEDMSRRAMQSVADGAVKFYPDSWAKPCLSWLENLRDWCISRQIWWGHRIPVYYCASSSINPYAGTRTPTTDCAPCASVESPAKCPHCGGAEMVQDADVLDTWFSSALWPFSVMGWPEIADNADLKYYYPTSVLVTGHEILYLWVARMVQMGLEFMDAVPFKHVYIHGIVRDKFGKKMSKSLGNVIDPLGVMEKYGTDALRFSLTQSAAPGRDMQLSEDSFLSARNFANKIWNASRFIMMNVRSVDWGKDFIMAVWPLELCDHWILSEYRILVGEVTVALDSYNMDAAARLIYEFFWSKYCDWYIELAKIRIAGTDAEKRKVALSILTEILAGVLRLLHPIMPFITEEIWSHMAELDFRAKKGPTIALSSWPEVNPEKIDTTAIARMRALQEIVTAVRTIRSEMNVPPGKLITAVINVSAPETREMIEQHRQYVQYLAKLETLTVGSALPRPPQSAMFVGGGIELFVPLAGIIDLEKEKTRLKKESANAAAEIERCTAKLNNADFSARAPASEVAKMKARLAEAVVKSNNLDTTLKAMEGR
ncbi:MAG: valine--tRNA ligase [Elusimicrobia bacterium]|nr:valine--tRNA ligase [Elusimicrobiota bacterium]